MAVSILPIRSSTRPSGGSSGGAVLQHQQQPSWMMQQQQQDKQQKAAAIQQMRRRWCWSTRAFVVLLAVAVIAAIDTTTTTTYNNKNGSFIITRVESFVQHTVPVRSSKNNINNSRPTTTTTEEASSTHSSSRRDVVLRFKGDLLRRNYRVNSDLEEEEESFDPITATAESGVACVDEQQQQQQQQQALMMTPKPPTTVPPEPAAVPTTTEEGMTAGTTTATTLSGAAAYSYFAVEKKKKKKNSTTATTTETGADVNNQDKSNRSLGDGNDHNKSSSKASNNNNMTKVRTTTTTTPPSSSSATLIHEIDDVLKDVANVLHEVNTKLDATSAAAAAVEEEKEVVISPQGKEEEGGGGIGTVNDVDVVDESTEKQLQTGAAAEEEEQEDMTLTNVIQNYFAVVVDDDEDEEIVDVDVDDVNGGGISDGSVSFESNTLTQEQDRKEVDASIEKDGKGDRDEYDDVLNSYLDDEDEDEDDDEDFDGEDHFEDDDSDGDDDGVESPIKEDPIRDLTFALRDAAVDGSFALLRGLRYTAAAALSSTLPKKERKELMERVVAPASSSNTGSEMGGLSSDGSANPSKGDAQMDDPLIDLRGSVQEEIALAVREVARRNEDLWQEERDVIAAQLEDAANARVEAELKIQQQRLDHEKELWQKTELSAMRADLKEQIAYLQEQLRQAEDAKQQVLGQNVSAAVENAKEELIQQEAQKMEDLQRLLKKRQTQQEKLDAVEESLKRRAVQIKAEKEKVERLEQQQKLSSALSSFGNVQPGVISSAPQRKQYRPFAQHQKIQQQVSNLPVSGGFVSSDQSAAQRTNSEHPLLGPLIADLGYKKIYLSSSIELGTIPIWSRQRTYRNDRARRMAADKSRSLHLGFPGAVCLYEDTDGSLSILDGQHRIGMMQILREHRNKQREKRIQNDDVVSAEDETYAKYFDNVLVEVYTNNASSNQNNTDPPIKPDQVFLEINKAEPVQLVDMPGVAPAGDRMVITEAVETLQHQFPKMFSPSQKCRVPNVNVDNLRNSIFGANVLKRLASKNRKKITSQHLIQWLLIQNARIGDKYESYFEENGKPMFVSQKAWEKASRNGFYLGLESSWLYSKK